MTNETKQIYFRMVAYTDAAGKFNKDAYRCGNEDNFYVDDDLSDSVLDHIQADKILPLGSKGLLMVVADGMGGMNAGEVASEMAINTVREYFAQDKISENIAATHAQRSAYMERVIKEADKRIKTESATNREHEGMGTTMILAWLYENQLSVTWCGDSRAYLFNQTNGITLLSEDHSYVQELVKKGIITYEQTFDHPQGNIITRSVGDPDRDAVPESRLFQVGKGDIILLCSDGLSGVLRDKKIVENGQVINCPNLEDILRTNTHSMQSCREALWQAAEAADWYDNVTVILCQITDGEAAVYQQNLSEPTKAGFWNKQISFKAICIAVAVIFILGMFSFWCVKNKPWEKVLDGVSSIQTDSLEIACDTTNVEAMVVSKNDTANVENSNAFPKEKKETKSQKVEEKRVAKDSTEKVVDAKIEEGIKKMVEQPKAEPEEPSQTFENVEPQEEINEIIEPTEILI